jgi:hypothetical protein
MGPELGMERPSFGEPQCLLVEVWISSCSFEYDRVVGAMWCDLRGVCSEHTSPPRAISLPRSWAQFETEG